MNWKHRRGDKISASLTYCGHYVISHRPNQFCLRYRPPGCHFAIGDYPTLAKAKKAAENHTFDSAARAIRTIFADSIAKTWSQYDKQQRRQGFWLNSHSAALLVLEQVHGLNWRTTRPDAFRDAAIALGKIIPELFADYWLTVEP